MPLNQMLFLIGVVAAFALLGGVLAFCRAVSKDLPEQP